MQNDEWLESTWESPDIAVAAFSNRDSQVVAFTLTSMGPDFAPLVEYVRGGIRLRNSLFADIPDTPTGIEGIYPPNAAYSYEEFFAGVARLKASPSYLRRATQRTLTTRRRPSSCN